MGQEKTPKEKASKRNRKNDSKPFVYPYDLGWRRNLSQVSGGELYALHTPSLPVCRLLTCISNSAEIAASGELSI